MSRIILHRARYLERRWNYEYGRLLNQKGKLWTMFLSFFCKIFYSRDLQVTAN